MRCSNPPRSTTTSRRFGCVVCRLFDSGFTPLARYCEATIRQCDFRESLAQSRETQSTKSGMEEKIEFRVFSDRITCSFWVLLTPAPKMLDNGKREKHGPSYGSVPSSLNHRAIKSNCFSKRWHFFLSVRTASKNSSSESHWPVDSIWKMK